MKRALLSAALTLGIGWSGAAGASVIFQSIPDLNVAPEINGWPSGPGHRVYDKFTVSLPKVWVGQVIYSLTSPSPVVAALSIHADNGGLPGQVLFSGSTDASDGTTFVETAFGTTIVTMPMIWGGLPLFEGTYWLELFGPSIPAYGGGSGSLLSFVPETGYVSRGDSAGFIVATAVPEIPVWIMMLIGFGALVLLAATHRGTDSGGSPSRSGPCRAYALAKAQGSAGRARLLRKVDSWRQPRFAPGPGRVG